MREFKNKNYGSLSQFIGVDCELYRSSDQKNTAIYFTDEQEKESYFELLILKKGKYNNWIFLRYPNTDYFVELHGAGGYSGRGTMQTGSSENVWLGDTRACEIHIMKQDSNLLLIMGSHNFGQFNFMTRVAQIDSGNEFVNNPQRIVVNEHEISEALSKQYLMLPDARAIQYAFKTKAENPMYIVVDYPAFDFKYENHRLVTVENNCIQQYTLKRFMRARDGGSTKMLVLDSNGIEHELLAPTSIPTKQLPDTWDKQELLIVSEEEKDGLMKRLGLIEGEI